MTCAHMNNASTIDILTRLANIIARWREFYKPGHMVRVRADIVTHAHLEIEKLRAALARIDSINDNPARYNPDIEVAIRAVLPIQKPKVSPSEIIGDPCRDLMFVEASEIPPDVYGISTMPLAAWSKPR